MIAVQNIVYNNTLKKNGKFAKLEKAPSSLILDSHSKS